MHVVIVLLCVAFIAREVGRSFNPFQPPGEASTSFRSGSVSPIAVLSFEKDVLGRSYLIRTGRLLGESAG